MQVQVLSWALFISFLPSESRSYPIPSYIRTSFRTLSTISPKLAARLAEPLFFRPLRFPVPEREMHFRKSAISGFHKNEDGRIHWFHIPGAGRNLLFVHGWSGRGSQFANMMEAAAESGYNVYTFDAPGHGEELKKRTDMLAFVRAILWMNEEFGPFELAVGHSLGGMALWNAYAQGLPLKKLVNIGSPSSIEGVLGDFVNAIGARLRVRDHMLQTLAAKYEIEPATLSPVSIVRESKVLKGALVHDEDDHDVPIVHAEALAKVWTEADFIRSSGLGHRRILRDQEVIRRCLQVLSV